MGTSNAWKNGFALVKFVEDKVTAIAPFSIIRNCNKTPFKPVSAEDIPRGPAVTVRWQPPSGSFSFDGFFEAEVLAISTTLENLKIKAKSLKIKLADVSVLDIDDAPSSKMNSSERTSGTAQRVSGSVSDTRRKGSDDRKRDKDRNRSKESHHQQRSYDRKDTGPKEHSSSCPKKPESHGSDKEKKEKRKAATSSGLQNVDGSEKPEAPKKKRKPNPAAQNSVSCARLENIHKDAVSTNPLLSSPKLKVPNTGDSKIDSPCDNLSVKVRSPFTPSINFDETLHTEQQNRLKRSVSRNLFEGSVEERTDQSAVSFKCGRIDTDLDCQLSPAATKYSATGSANESDDDSETTLPIIMEDKLPHKEINLDTDSDSSSKSSGDFTNSSSDDEMVTVLKKRDAFRERKQFYKVKAREHYREMVLANNLRLKYKTEVDTLKEEVNVLIRRNNMLQDLMCNQDRGAAKQSTMSSKSPAEKPKKSKKDEILHNSDSINLTSEKVLRHLKGIEKLVPNSQGMVEIGNGVTIHLESLERNLKDNKLDIEKASKHLTSLTWTHTERCERSLHGEKSNKHSGTPPKLAATPVKLASILGIMKAHMANMGEEEGPAMDLNLKKCMKAIGSKLATDGYRKKTKAEKDSLAVLQERR